MPKKGVTIVASPKEIQSVATSVGLADYLEKVLDLERKGVLVFSVVSERKED